MPGMPAASWAGRAGPTGRSHRPLGKRPGTPRWAWCGRARLQGVGCTDARAGGSWCARSDAVVLRCWIVTQAEGRKIKKRNPTKFKINHKYFLEPFLVAGGGWLFWIIEVEVLQSAWRGRKVFVIFSCVLIEETFHSGLKEQELGAKTMIFCWWDLIGIKWSWVSPLPFWWRLHLVIKG